MKNKPKLGLCIAFMLSITFCHSQSNKDCTYQTDGSGKAKGLKISMTYPCSYIQMEAQTDPKTIKKFSFHNGKNVISLFIDKLPGQVKEKDIADNFSLENIKRSLQSQGEVNSIKTIVIDGIPSTEAVWTSKGFDVNGNEFYTKSLTHFIIHNRYFIQVIYGTNASTKTQLDKNFASLELNYRKLAKAIDILN
jgi:hypothetical protein